MPSPSLYQTLLVVALLHTALTQTTFNFTFSDDVNGAFYIYEGQILPLNITIPHDVPPGVLSFKSSDTIRFKIENDTDFQIPSDAIFPYTFSVQIKAKMVSIEDLKITYLKEGNSEIEDVGSHIIKVMRVPKILDVIFDYTLLLWLIIGYVSMGSKLDLRTIWSKFKPPWGILIGMFCQFFVMPALAFFLSWAFVLDNTYAIGLIFDGTCPGGWLSNIFSLLLECDIVLSLTMTFLSTIVALGMMPLNLFLYGNFYVDNEALQTPYGDLCIQLAVLLIPVGLGMLLVYKFPKFRDICEKLLKPISVIIILVALGMGMPTSVYVFYSPWEVWAVASLFPLIGTIIGGIIAKLFCLENRSAITVALETGSQNSLLAKTMVALFYPKPEADLVASVPVLISFLSLMEGSAITIGYYVISRWVCGKKGDDEEEGLDGKEGSGKKQNLGNIEDSSKMEKQVIKDSYDLANVAHVNPTFVTE